MKVLFLQRVVANVLMDIILINKNARHAVITVLNVIKQNACNANKTSNQLIMNAETVQLNVKIVRIVTIAKPLIKLAYKINVN